MPKAALKRAAETVRAPATREEAETMLARIGELMRAQQRRQADLDEAVAAAKSKAEQEARQPAAEQADLMRGLQIWAEANRKVLTQDGRTKTVKLATGEIAWRLRPPSVRLSKLDAVIEAIQAMGQKGKRFLRTKVEVNKEALLGEQEVAKTIPGVSIGSAGEEFVVAPTGLDLAPGTPA